MTKKKSKDAVYSKRWRKQNDITSIQLPKKLRDKLTDLKFEFRVFKHFAVIERLVAEHEARKKKK